MKLAPRMIQSMEILQLSVMDLQDKIDEALEENVVLEKAPVETNSESQTEERTKEKDIDQQEIVVDNDHSNEADFERLVEMSNEWPDDNAMSTNRVSSNQISDNSDRQHDQIANLVDRPQSLQDHLMEQFHFVESSNEVREFGEYLLQNLDKNGRLQGTLPEIAQVYGKPIEIETAQNALDIIQKFEPKGIGARDLKECLLIQVPDDMVHRDVIVTLISSHLDDLAQNRLPLIQRKTGYSIELIKEAVEEMRILDPFPGRAFESSTVQKVTPDVFLERDENGEYTIRLENERVPELRISRKYITMLQNNPDATTKEYIRKKVEAAKWLIESIEQRYNTLKRVSQAIVDFQTEFLEKGEEFIVPLKMQQIADVVGVHVTTISRAVDDKWIQTPRGVFALKRFFGGGTTAANGEEVAWDIIRLKLKEIIDNEDKVKPLSDDALVDELGKLGYPLARRTVTKYRKGMNIPSSRQRREY